MNDNQKIEEWACAYINLLSQSEEIDFDDPLCWAMDKTIYCLRQNKGEELWLFILAVLNKDPIDRVIADLAAGPLEDLIAYSGANFIDRIEAMVQQNSKFRHLLGGVWQNRTPQDIWQRIEEIQDKVW